MKRLILAFFALCIAGSAISQIIIGDLTAEAAANNVLRYTVSFTTGEVTYAYVEWQRTSGGGEYSAEHSNIQGPSDTFTFNLLGFVSQTDYQYRIIAWNAGGYVTSDWSTLTTGSLPSDVSHITHLYTNEPGLSGYYMTNNLNTPDKTIQIYNRSGEVVWYDWHAGEDGAGGIANCQFWTVSDAGNIIVTDCHAIEERDLFGNVIHSVDFTGTEWENLAFHHDIKINTDGNYYAIVAEVREFDFTSLGGSATQQVIGEGILEFDALGNVIWYWTTFDHWDPVAAGATNQNAFFQPIFGVNAINWQHLNSLTQDYDGNYLLSFKELNRLAKVDRATGDIIWTMSGNDPSIALQNDAGFEEQHDFTPVEPNKYILFDNVNGPHSRLVEFAIDFYKVPIAYRTFEFAFPDSLMSPIVGSARRLAGGHRYGVCGAPGANPANRGHIIEIDEENNIVWHARQSSWFYRAYFYEYLWETQEIDLVLQEHENICPGSTVTLSAVPEGGYWYGEGVENGSFTATDPGNYWLYYTYGWATDSIEVTVVPAAEILVLTQSPLCFGGSEGFAQIIVNGQTEATIFDLTAGTYEYMFSDENGCMYLETYEITQPDELTCNVTTTNETSGGDGTACVEVSGGTVAYFITWGTGENTECIEDLAAGSYTLSVTDAQGCTCEQTFDILTGVSEENLEMIKVYPNPSEDVLNISGIPASQIRSLLITDASGRVVYSQNNPTQTRIDISGLASGAYTIRLITESGESTLPVIKR